MEVKETVSPQAGKIDELCAAFARQNAQNEAVIQALTSETKELKERLNDLHLESRYSSPHPPPLPRRDFWPRDQPRSSGCFSCGREGHFSRDCWRNQPPANSRFQRQDFRENLEDRGPNFRVTGFGQGRENGRNSGMSNPQAFRGGHGSGHRDADRERRQYRSPPRQAGRPVGGNSMTRGNFRSQRNLNLREKPEPCSYKFVPVTSMNYVSDSDHTLPLVEVKIGGETFLALVDTGAQVSLLDPQAFHKLRGKVKVTPVKSDVQVRGTTGRSVPLEACWEVPLLVGKKRIVHPLHVPKQKMSDLYQLIMGYDILREHGYRFDAGTGTLTASDEVESSISPPVDKDRNFDQTLIGRARCKSIIPPRSEKIIPVNCQNFKAAVSTVLVEPEADRIRRLQREDRELFPIIEALEGKPSNVTAKAKDSFYLQDGLLYHFSAPDRRPTRSEYFEQLVVPMMMRAEVLEACHETPSAAHLGFEKTLARVRESYFWVNMYSDVRNFVDSCQSCLERRGYKPNAKAPLLRHEVPDAPFTKVAMDILGPLPLTLKGNRYILVCIDIFTRYVEVAALPDMKASTIADSFIELIVARHGVPGSILTDRGTNFQSELMSELLEKLGVKRLRTSAFHPSSNGICERANKTITQCLSHFVSEEMNNWDSCLPYFLMAYRSAIHSATQDSPNWLVFGRDVALPHDLMSTQPKHSYYSYEDYNQTVNDRLQRAYRVVKENLEKAAEKQEKYRLRHSVQKGIVVGDIVYLWTPQVKRSRTKKLARLSTGPWRVTKVLSAVNVEIKLVTNPRKTQRVHIDRLTKAVKRKPYLDIREPEDTPLEQVDPIPEDVVEDNRTPGNYYPEQGDEEFIDPVYFPSLGVPPPTAGTAHVPEERSPTVAEEPTHNPSARQVGADMPAEEIAGYNLRPRNVLGQVRSRNAQGENPTAIRALAQERQQRTEVHGQTDRHANETANRSRHCTAANTRCAQATREVNQLAGSTDFPWKHHLETYV